jgi:hypothetical protein
MNHATLNTMSPAPRPMRDAIDVRSAEYMYAGAHCKHNGLAVAFASVGHTHHVAVLRASGDPRSAVPAWVTVERSEYGADDLDAAWSEYLRLCAAWSVLVRRPWSALGANAT